jgi:enolase-phosphatase E1
LISAIVTDIEGTTSSIRFVKEVLFPYAAEQIPGFVRTHQADPDVRAHLVAVADSLGTTIDDPEPLISRLLEWIASDTKATALKSLQGMIWKQGYEQGDYQAHFYPDAVASMNTWHDRGIPVYVYSSGSILAQQLFFRYSDHGDLRPLISGWFDTTTGPKHESDSYRKIRAELGRPAGEILFLSDVVAELDAAGDAGFETVLLARPMDSDVKKGDSIGHRIIEKFDEVDLSGEAYS